MRRQIERNVLVVEAILLDVLGHHLGRRHRIVRRALAGNPLFHRRRRAGCRPRLDPLRVQIEQSVEQKQFVRRVRFGRIETLIEPTQQTGQRLYQLAPFFRIALWLHAPDQFVSRHQRLPVVDLGIGAALGQRAQQTAPDAVEQVLHHRRQRRAQPVVDSVVGSATRFVAAQTFLLALFGQTGGRFGTPRLFRFERIDETCKIAVAGFEQAHVALEVAQDAIDDLRQLHVQRVVVADIAAPSQHGLRDEIEQTARRVGLAGEEAAIQHGHLDQRDLQPAHQRLDRIGDVRVVKDEVEQHRDDVDRDRVELPQMPAEIGTAEIAQYIDRNGKADTGTDRQMIGLGLQRAQRLEHERRDWREAGGGHRATGGRQRNALGRHLPLHQLSQHRIDVALAIETADAGQRRIAEALMHRGRAEALRHRRAAEVLCEGHGAGIRPRRRRLLASRCSPGTTRPHRGHRRAPEPAAQSRQHILAHQPGIQFLIKTGQLTGNLLFERLQQHQPHLHARIDHLGRRTQRIGDGFRTYRVVGVSRVLLAEQAAQALLDRVQILVAVFLQLAGDFADSQILGQLVLIDQTQLVERFRRGGVGGLQRLAAHASIEIA